MISFVFFFYGSHRLELLLKQGQWSDITSYWCRELLRKKFLKNKEDLFVVQLYRDGVWFFEHSRYDFWSHSESLADYSSVFRFLLLPIQCMFSNQTFLKLCNHFNSFLCSKQTITMLRDEMKIELSIFPNQSQELWKFTD